MNSIRIKWTDPVVRADGSPLDPAEIGQIAVSIRVGGSPDFTLFSVVGAGVQEALVTDLPPGSYDIEIVVFDNQRIPQASTAFVISGVSIDAPLKAAPGPVTDATATVE